MKHLMAAIAATLVAAIWLVAPAFAGETTWDGNGSENLPCEEGGHWVLSPAKGITSATLTVNGVTYTMVQNGKGSFAADSAGPLDENTTASAVWEGDNDTAFLKLSHCTESSGTTGGTTTGGETTGETTGATTGSETTGSETTTGGSTTGVSTTGSGSTGGTTGGSAKTPVGGELPFTGLPMWIPLLAAAGLIGSGILLVRRRT